MILHPIPTFVKNQLHTKAESVSDSALSLSAYKCGTLRLGRYHCMASGHINMLGGTVAVIIVTTLHGVTQNVGCALRLTFTRRGHTWAALLAK